MQDATDVFSAFHAGTTWQLLRARQIGTCTDVSPDLLLDFRRLRADMQAARLFDSNKLYYAWKCSSNLAICATSLSILRYSSSFTALFAAAFLMVRRLSIAESCAPRLTRALRRRCSGSSAAGWRTISCTTRRVVSASTALVQCLRAGRPMHRRCSPTGLSTTSQD